MNTVFCNAADLAWEPAKGYSEGALAKVLREGNDSGGWTILLKLPSGWHMPSHSHRATEQHYVLEGEYEIEGRVLGKGSYQLIPKDTYHGPIFTLTGVTLLVVWDGDLQAVMKQ